MGEKLTKYPEYEPEAIFRCSQGCGRFRRDRCGTFRGRLHCPVCRYVGTLAYVTPGLTALSEKDR